MLESLLSDTRKGIDMKPKIIGLVNAWYSERWIAAAIEQALRYCDEVIVAIGAHSSSLASLEDRTYEIAYKYSDRITLLKSSMSSVHDKSKADTLNRMLSASSIRQKGNWVWILDVDEFYFDCTYEKISESIASGLYDHMRVEEKFFFINMTRYLLMSHGRLFRIGQSSDKFMPTQRWTGSMANQGVIKQDNKEMGMFHYSLLVDTEYRRRMWTTEHTYGQPHLLRWLDEVYIPYDLNDEKTWIAKNEQLFGVKAPFLEPNAIPDKDGKLFVYNGKHPPVIEATTLPQVKDFG